MVMRLSDAARAAVRALIFAVATALTLGLLLAQPASAGTWVAGARGVTAYERIVYEFTSADSTSDALTTFTVRSTEALACFVSDTAGAPAGTAQIQLRLYPTGDTTEATVPLGGANGNAYLDGTGGAASTQNACMWIGPGLYALDVQTVCGAGDACALAVQGAGVER